MERLLGDSASLGDLKLRQRQFQLGLTWTGGSNLTLPAYDSTLQVGDAQPL